MLNRQRYTLEDHPKFKNGDVVDVDMAQLGDTDLKVLTGKIVGISVKNIVDYWLVEFDQDFGPTYPFKVACIPHLAILKP